MLLPLSVCYYSRKPNDSCLSLKRVIPMGIDGGLAVGGGVALYYLLQALCPQLGMGGQIGVATGFTLIPIGIDIVALFLVSRKNKKLSLSDEPIKQTPSQIFFKASKAFVDLEREINEIAQELQVNEALTAEVNRQKYIACLDRINTLYHNKTGHNISLGVKLREDIQKETSFSDASLFEFNRRFSLVINQVYVSYIDQELPKLINPLFLDWIKGNWFSEIQRDRILLPLWDRNDSGEMDYDTLNGERTKEYVKLTQSLSQLSPAIEDDYYISLMPKPVYVFDMLKLLVECIEHNESLKTIAADTHAWIHLSRSCCHDTRDVILIEIRGKENAEKFLAELFTLLEPDLDNLGSNCPPDYSIHGNNPLMFLHHGNPIMKRIFELQNPVIFKSIFTDSGRSFNPRFHIEEFSFPGNF